MILFNLQRIYGITVVKLSIISILAPFRPLFNPLEVLGYPSNEYFSFHTVQVYLSNMTICNDFVQLAANIWHYRSEIVDN